MRSFARNTELIAKSAKAQRQNHRRRLRNKTTLHQPDSALSQWFHDRTQGQKGRIRRVMIVALARKLAIALTQWRYLETGLIPEGAVVK